MAYSGEQWLDPPDGRDDDDRWEQARPGDIADSFERQAQCDSGRDGEPALLTREEQFSRWVSSHITTDEAGYRTASTELTAYARRRAMGIPKEHEHATFGTFKAPTYLYEDAREQVRDWANTWHNKLETAHSLILCGPTGTGKSHLAASAMKRMSAHRGLAPKWIGFARLLDILGTFDREYDAVSDYGKGINCLCIDDMGETSITDGKGKLSRAGERFVIVLRARMEDLLPTIITTNLTSYHGQTSVARFFGSDDRVTSRMSRAYHWIDINLPDWRVR